jgi:TolB protein
LSPDSSINAHFVDFENKPEGRAGALLTVTPASGDPRTYPLQKDVTAIGRSADNMVALSGDKRASRRHAEIRREEDAYVLYDLESSNGTFVGETRVSRHTLQDGDQIRIGDAVLSFALTQPESSVEAEVSIEAAEEPMPSVSAVEERVQVPNGDAAASEEQAEAEVDRLLLLAERAERENKPAKALELYHQALTYLVPGSPLYREVHSICQELEESQAPTPKADASNRETPPAAVAVSAAEESPDEFRVMLERAERMEQSGDIAGAVSIYQDLLDRLPATSPLRHEVGMINAATAARKAGRSEADRLVAQAQRLEEQGDVESALAAYRQAAAEVSPTSALGRELSLVITDLESRSHDRLQMDMAAGHRAEGLEGAGRWSDASAAYEELLAETTDPAIRSRWESRLAYCQEEMVMADLFYRGVEAAQASDWQQAQHLFNQIVRRRPTYQLNGQMAAMWLDAVKRRLSPPRKSRLALWSAAGGVLVLLILVVIAAGAFVLTRSRQGAQATAVAERVATLQAAQTLTAVAALPPPTQPPTPSPLPTFTAAAPVVPAASLGGKIAFASDRAGHWDIYTIRPDGTGMGRVTDSAGADTEPAWSPDGQRLAFVSDRDGNLEIYVMAADGSSVTRLTDDPGVDTTPAWSPDGQRIVFASNRETGGDRMDLWVMDADGANATLLAVDATEPDWASDGSRIAAVFRFPNLVTIGRAPVHESAGPQPLLELAGSAWPAWSPNDSMVAFSAPAEGGEHIFRVNADGSNVVDVSAAIEQAGQQPTWAPDGRHIAFVSTVDSNQDIYIASVEGGMPIRLTADPGKDASPAWSR